jgi:hypothetical protein
MNSAENTEQFVDKPKEKATAHSGVSGALGNFAYAHKDFFQHNLAFRNFARTLTAIAPYVFVNVGVQHLFQRTVGSGKNFGKYLTPILKHPITQSTAAIAFSFTTFRSVSKLWNASYDRIFGAQSPDEAAEAISALPANIAHDAVAIVPSEFAASGLSAITLAAVRGSLKTPEPPMVNGVAKKWAVGEHYANDWLANSLGYTVFFEASDRLYSAFNPKHPNGQYTNGTVPDDGKPDTKYDSFTDDTPARVAFRNGASVFMAALPFIAMQRFANFKTGGYNPAKNSYLTDVKHGLLAWELPFAVFTSGVELWQRNYDKLFDKLKAKDTAQER